MNYPPAFPLTEANGSNNGEPGMTLRDYFAAHALANEYTEHKGDPSRVAKWAYDIADAMLKARESLA